MCDTIIKRRLLVAERPHLVYKRVQLLPDGRLITPIAGAILERDKWQIAPDTSDKIGGYNNSTLFAEELKKLGIGEDWVHSGHDRIRKEHSGRWSAFVNKRDAQWCNLCSNWRKEHMLKTVIAECLIRGRVDRAEWGHHKTILASSIKVLNLVQKY